MQQETQAGLVLKDGAGGDGSRQGGRKEGYERQKSRNSSAPGKTLGISGQ